MTESLDLRTFTYVDTVNNYLECSICLDVLADPRMTPCDHLFCHECILLVVARSRRCPMDRLPFNPSDLKSPPQIVKDMLNELIVYCPHQLQGCTYQGERQHMAQHVIHECGYASEACRRLRSKVQKLQPTKDPKRLIACPNCEDVVHADRLEYHIKGYCDKVVVACTKIDDGCNWTGFRSERHKHMETDHRPVRRAPSPVPSVEIQECPSCQALYLGAHCLVCRKKQKELESKANPPSKRFVSTANPPRKEYVYRQILLPICSGANPPPNKPHGSTFKLDKIL
ncbi:hypothetical protein BC940DRAFT_307434 [Gongronella butleri]|nr:hypothetical protein BC940DRAFT_307434 [Gongronella butleri]